MLTYKWTMPIGKKYSEKVVANNPSYNQLPHLVQITQELNSNVPSTTPCIITNINCCITLADAHNSYSNAYCTYLVILLWDHRYCPLTFENNKHFSVTILYQLNCKTCFSGCVVQYTAIQKRFLIYHTVEIAVLGKTMSIFMSVHLIQVLQFFILTGCKQQLQRGGEGKRGNEKETRTTERVQIGHQMMNELAIHFVSNTQKFMN